MYDNSHTDFFSTDLPASDNPSGENHEKNCPETRRTGFKKGDFL